MPQGTACLGSIVLQEKLQGFIYKLITIEQRIADDNKSPPALSSKGSTRWRKVGEGGVGLSLKQKTTILTCLRTKLRTCCTIFDIIEDKDVKLEDIGFEGIEVDDW